jgi:hypothetical protein
MRAALRSVAEIAALRNAPGRATPQGAAAVVARGDGTPHKEIK